MVTLLAVCLSLVSSGAQALQRCTPPEASVRAPQGSGVTPAPRYGTPEQGLHVGVKDARVLGSLLSQAIFEVRYSIAPLPARSTVGRQRWCVRTIDVTLGYRNVAITVERGLRGARCAVAGILAHERAHADINARAGVEARRWLADRLSRTPLVVDAKDAGQARAIADRQVRTLGDGAVARMVGSARGRHTALDVRSRSVAAMRAFRRDCPQDVALMRKVLSQRVRQLNR